jgi:hypothetical protein
MQDTFARKAKVLIAKLDARAAEAKAAGAPVGSAARRRAGTGAGAGADAGGVDSNPIDMQANFFAFTMDSIMSIFYNAESDTLSGVEKRYAAAYDEAHSSLLKYMFTGLPMMSLLKMLPWPFGSLTSIYVDSARCTFSDSNLHPRMPLDLTHVRLKRAGV